jgi:Glyoxalase/Bleomycin resistance protein/Dioxygenase superfamily
LRRRQRSMQIRSRPSARRAVAPCRPPAARTAAPRTCNVRSPGPCIPPIVEATTSGSSIAHSSPMTSPQLTNGSRRSRSPISRYGPQRLLSGIVAFKFRDPDLLELIQFPRPDLRTEGGIDHSAISVADAERSIAFYAERLGLSLQSRQVNRGPAGYSKGAAGPQPNLP